MNFTKEFTPIEKSRMKLSVVIAQDEVQKHYVQLTDKYAKQLQIPGFRKGKVPVKILEQKFGESLRAESCNEAIDAVLHEIFDAATEYERPLPYSRPVFETDPDFAIDQELKFVVTYDVFPSVTVTKVEGFTIEVPKVSIDENDIAEELERIRERNSLVMDRPEDALLEEGNIATVDFVELDENGAEVENTKRDGFVFTLGKGQLRYEVDTELVGMKKGEEKIVSKAYPADHIDTYLAGKEKKLRVVLTALKEKKLPDLDDDLAQDVNEKYKTLDDLKADLRKTLAKKVEDEIENRKINSLLMQLADANPIELPQSMIDTEIESRWVMMANRFGISPERLEQLTATIDPTKSKSAMMEEWRPEAELRLKTRLIVEALMKERGITANPEDAEAEYAAIADLRDTSADEVKKYYDEHKRDKEYLVDTIKEKKLYAQLFEKVTIKEGAVVTVAELFAEDKNNAGIDA